MLFNTSVPPFIVLLLLLPLFSALLIIGLEFVKYIPMFKAGGGKPVEFGRLPLKVFFFASIVLETILALYICCRSQSVKSASYVLIYSGWGMMPSGFAGSLMRANVQVDAFSASAAAMTSLVALVSCLLALPGKKHEFTYQRAALFLLTLSGVMGVYFSGGLIIMFISVALSQIGATGLTQPVLNERSEIGSTMAHLFSRFAVLVMCFAGCAILALRYDVFSIQALSGALRAASAERIAFALMAAPLLFLFIKPPYHTEDSASRCYFALRASAAFFAFFKIVFMLYGAMAGLERIPLLIGIIGMAVIFTSLLFASGERNPIKFASMAESLLKGLILVAMAISLSSIYNVASVASYGYDATVAVISLWLLFLPVSATLSVTSVHLVQESNEIKLWLMKGMSSKLPFTGLLYTLAICMLGGLPPLIGYTGRQLLYRSANHINPFLTLALFIPSLFILYMGLRFIFTIMFGKRKGEVEAMFVGDRPITLPLLILTCIIVTGTVLPGRFHSELVQPSVNILLSGVRHVGNAQYWSEPGTGGGVEYNGEDDANASEDNGEKVKEEGELP